MKDLNLLSGKSSEWYRRWHETSGHAFTHWLVFILVAVVISGQISERISLTYSEGSLKAAIGSTITPRFVSSAGNYFDSKGAAHDVGIWSLINTYDGGTEYFLLSLPSVGVGPYPVIIFNNAYSVFPSPPSINSEDTIWTERVRQSKPNYDISISSRNKAFTCSTQDCPIPVAGLANLIDLPGLSEGRSVDWAITNGYAVAISFARHYAARDILAVIYGTENVIGVLKNMSSIDPRRIGITGGSQGGQLSIHPLVLNSIAASVAEFPWVDARAQYDYYFNTLPAVQPAGLLTISLDFVRPYYNRLAAAFGPDPRSSLWDVLTTDYAAQRLDTPILLVQGTDDMMIPSRESENLYSALKNKGKTANKWIYQNGSAPLTTKSINEGGHGILDANSPVKRGILARNFFLQYMPPNVSEIVHTVPGDVDLIAMLSAFRSVACSVSAEKENISGLISQAANPKIKYLSSDPRIPTASGPEALAAAINNVWANEGISWRKEDVINNLQNGLLPTTCNSTRPIASASPTVVATPISTPIAVSAIPSATGKISIISNQYFCWHFVSPGGEYDDCGASVYYPNSLKGQYTISIKLSPKGYHLQDYSPHTDTQYLTENGEISWSADWQPDNTPSAPVTTFSITTASDLPDAVVGQVYATSFTAIGGDGDYSWSISSGIPPGIFKSACSDNFCGSSGIPSSAGTYTFVVKVVSGDRSASKTFKLKVVPSPSVGLKITTPSDLPIAMVGKNYSVVFTATGGSDPYVWSLVSGIPNTELFRTTCVSNTCTSAGIPTVSGVYKFTVTLRSGAQVTQKSFTLQVSQ